MGDTCEACGWAAAVLSMLAFGSFGAPIKGHAARSVDIDPLVFQSYKTFMCLATCWIVLCFHQEFTYTPWGIVSGLFWVPGGVAAIYAIKAAGLAVGIGIGSSFIVLVSFTWGIFIFDEHVQSRFGACFAILLMMAGLWGMSYYSSLDADPMAIVPSMDEDDVDSQPTQISQGDGYHGVLVRDKEEARITDSQSEYDPGSIAPSSLSEDAVHMCGMKITRRRLGLAAAAFNGIWGGSIMVPMKWSPGNTNGMGYLISFAIGASLVTTFLWIMRYSYHVGQTGSFMMAYRALPSFHLRIMWLAGGTSGTLWSIGNLFSMIAVEHLGEGVGYSVVQAAMLVSGLWGIFFFHEVVGTATISKWFASASLTVCGIILLSYEHHSGSIDKG